MTMTQLPTVQTLKRVLHVGCGGKNPEKLHPSFRGPQWVEVRLDIDPAVEPDIIGNMTQMPDDVAGKYDAVWSSHNLEHLYAHEVPIALGQFMRALRPGGVVLVTMPDLQAVAEFIAKGNLEDPIYTSPAGPISPIDVLYGWRPAIKRGNVFMAHRTGFTADSLRKKLEAAGFEAVRIERVDLNLWGTGRKPLKSSTQARQPLSE